MHLGSPNLTCKIPGWVLETRLFWGQMVKRVKVTSHKTLPACVFALLWVLASFSSVGKTGWLCWVVVCLRAENNDGLCCRLLTPCPKEAELVPFKNLEVPRKSLQLVDKLGAGQFGEVWAGMSLSVCVHCLLRLFLYLRRLQSRPGVRFSPMFVCLSRYPHDIS